LKLSAGVALAQTLPSGTGMLFSVDYHFTRGQPDPSARYYLVITSSKQGALTFDVRLSDRGTLQVIKERTEPTIGPFSAHVEASLRSASREVISDKVMLQQPGT
jgi:hypothetical protein